MRRCVLEPLIAGKNSLAFRGKHVIRLWRCYMPTNPRRVDDLQKQMMKLLMKVSDGTITLERASRDVHRTIFFAHQRGRRSGLLDRVASQDWRKAVRDWENATDDDSADDAAE